MAGKRHLIISPTSVYQEHADVWNQMGVPRSPELKEFLAPLFEKIKAMVRERDNNVEEFKLDNFRLSHFDVTTATPEQLSPEPGSPSTTSSDNEEPMGKAMANLCGERQSISIYVNLRHQEIVTNILVELASDPKTSELRKVGSSPVFVHILDPPYSMREDGDLPLTTIPAEHVMSKSGEWQPFHIEPISPTNEEDAALIRILSERLGAALSEAEQTQREGGTRPVEDDNRVRSVSDAQPDSVSPALNETSLASLVPEMIESIRGKRYEGVLTEYTNEVLQQVSDYVSTIWSTTKLSYRDLDHLHTQVDSLLYERRTQLYGFNIDTGMTEIVVQLSRFLKTSNGVDHVISVSVSSLKVLLGGSRFMIFQRLKFVQVLARAYEMKLAKEYFLKALEFLESALKEFELLEKIEATLGLSPSSALVEHSDAAELYGRVQHLYIMREVSEPEARSLAISSLIQFASTWIAKDKTNKLFDRAAWKVLGKAQKLLLLENPEDVPIMEQYITEAAKLGNHMTEPNKSQFYVEVEDALVLITSLKIATVAIDNADSTNDLPGFPTHLTGSVQEDNQTREFCNKPIMHLNDLLSWENTLTSRLKKKEVNPLIVMEQLELCHLMLCKAYNESFVMFNFKYMYFRPHDWAIFAITEQFRHLHALMQIQSAHREKIALTQGIDSLLKQIEFQDANSAKDTVPLAALWVAIKLGGYLSNLEGWKKPVMLAWRVWEVIQEMKARGMMGILSIAHHIPEEIQRALVTSFDPECHSLLAMERNIVKTLPHYSERLQSGLLQRLIDVRRKMALKSELTPHLKISPNSPLDPDGLLELYHSGVFGNNVTFVDWLVVDDGFSVTTCRPDLASGLKLCRTQVSVAAVNNWISNYKTNSDLREPEALEELELLKGLVKPVADYTDPGQLLVFCPTGILHQVPLHVLKVGSMIILERNPVLYCHSLSILRNMIHQFGSRQKHGIFHASLFGDPTGEPGHGIELSDSLGQKFGGLSHGRSSIEGLTKTLQASAFLGNDASTNNFYDAAQNSSLIHYHGHAAYDLPDVLDRGLVCSDTTLTSRRITQIPMHNSPLVVLIACASGAQVMHVRDEPLGIVPALIYAGASSIVGTLWPILDADGARFSNYFYEALFQKGNVRRLPGGAPVLNVAIALQRAVLRLRSDDNGARAEILYHWGAFFLCGSPCARAPTDDSIPPADFVPNETEPWKGGEDGFDFTMIDA